MKIKSFLAALIIFVSSAGIFAQDGFGIGGELLSPTGISYKVPINETSAITGAFGVLLSENFSNAVFEVNYLSYRDNSDLNIGSGNFSPYVGIGLSFRFIDDLDNDFAFKVPIGMEYKITSTPLELYMDIGPYVEVTDPVLFRFDSSFGFRYRF